MCSTCSTTEPGPQTDKSGQQGGTGDAFCLIFAGVILLVKEGGHLLAKEDVLLWANEGVLLLPMVAPELAITAASPGAAASPAAAKAGRAAATSTTTTTPACPAPPHHTIPTSGPTTSTGLAMMTGVLRPANQTRPSCPPVPTPPVPAPALATAAASLAVAAVRAGRAAATTTKTTFARQACPPSRTIPPSGPTTFCPPVMTT